MNKGKNAEEKKTRSLRIMNMHIPYHVLMVIWSFISIFPLWFLVINTFKVKKEIYLNFFGLPQKWTLENYQALMQNSDFFAFGRLFKLFTVGSNLKILRGCFRYVTFRCFSMNHRFHRLSYHRTDSQATLPQKQSPFLQLFRKASPLGEKWRQVMILSVPLCSRISMCCP